MKRSEQPLARVKATVPRDRVDITLGDGSLPQVGDIAEVDHIFTAPSGETMFIVICSSSDGSVRWVADMLETEIEAIPRDQGRRD